MTMHNLYEEIWRFETANFAVIAEAAPEETDPAGHFDDARDIEAIRSGDVAWFTARVRVVHLGTDIELGADYLGCCAYENPSDLFRNHARGVARLRQLRGKTDRASRRERKGLREILANNRQLKPPVTYCEYGPDMVREAISEARKTLAKLTQEGKIAHG
jgi:hypothetical protein